MCRRLGIAQKVRARNRHGPAPGQRAASAHGVAGGLLRGRLGEPHRPGKRRAGERRHRRRPARSQRSATTGDASAAPGRGSFRMPSRTAPRSSAYAGSGAGWRAGGSRPATPSAPSSFDFSSNAPFHVRLHPNCPINGEGNLMAERTSSTSTAHKAASRANSRRALPPLYSPASTPWSRLSASIRIPGARHHHPEEQWGYCIAGSASRQGSQR